MSIFDELDTEREEPPLEDRRKKPDWLVRAVTAISVIGWVCAIAALVMIDRARPAGENLFTRLLELPVIRNWNSTMLRWSYLAIIVSLLSSATGLICNSARMRRKSDRYSKLLVALCLVSVALLIIFLLRYSRYV